jgi:archaemetzincin
VKAVYVAALGAVDEEFLTAAEQGLAKAYGVQVRRLPPMEDPAYAFDAQRKQFSSAHVLRQLLTRMPADAMSLLALTGRDLFIPMLSFVLGQAQLNGPAAVVSLARLHQEFYGLPPDRQLVVERVTKEAVHEVGHTLGLIHCPDNKCPMSLSNNVLHVDIKGATLCENCAVVVEDKLTFLHPPAKGAGEAMTRDL